MVEIRIISVVQGIIRTMAMEITGIIIMETMVDKTMVEAIMGDRIIIMMVEMVIMVEEIMVVETLVVVEMIMVVEVEISVVGTLAVVEILEVEILVVVEIGRC